MFQTETKLNKFLIGYFENVVAKIPADRIAERPAGNGHPPVWVLGHLALCAEWGESFFGTEFTKGDWMPTFGPGSSDDVPTPDDYSKEEFVSLITAGYARLCDAASAGDEAAMAEPHGLELLAGTPIESKGDLIAHLLTTHFSFHLAQLSGWCRADGQSPLF